MAPVNVKYSSTGVAAYFFKVEKSFCRKKIKHTFFDEMIFIFCI